MEYYGIHTALATPFTKTGRAIDHRKLRALVDDQIAAGIHGLVVCGSTGEFPALSGKERRAVTETVCKAARGRVPVTVGVGAMSTVEALALARGCAASTSGRRGCRSNRLRPRRSRVSPS